MAQNCCECTCRCTMRMWMVEEARHDERTSEFFDGGDDNDNDNGTCLEADVICDAGG